MVFKKQKIYFLKITYICFVYSDPSYPFPSFANGLKHILYINKLLLEVAYIPLISNCILAHVRVQTSSNLNNLIFLLLIVIHDIVEIQQISIDLWLKRKNSWWWLIIIWTRIKRKQEYSSYISKKKNISHIVILWFLDKKKPILDPFIHLSEFVFFKLLDSYWSPSPLIFFIL